MMLAIYLSRMAMGRVIWGTGTYTAMTEEIHRGLGRRHLKSHLNCEKSLYNAVGCSSNVAIAWSENDCNKDGKKCNR